MSDVDLVLRRLREAAMVLRGTRGRQGMVVHLAEGEDVLVAGDLHGNLANFRRVLQLAKLSENPGRHLVLQEFVHGAGRYPNGGCTSHQLLDLVAALKLQYPHRVHLLLGNHELSEWTGRSIAKSGVQLNDLFADGLREAFGDRAEEVAAAYDQLYASMPLAVRTLGGAFISHSIPPLRQAGNFDVGLFERWMVPEEERGPAGSLHALVWGRDVSEPASRSFAELVGAKFLVTGHIVCEEGFRFPNPTHLIVDSTSLPAACVLLKLREAPTLQSVQCGVRRIEG
jgi:hypothetical protein